MPRTQTLSTIRTRCKRRADLENSAHISDVEWNALISEQYGELYEIVAGTGLRYFETTHTITADGSASYDEPDDHGKTVGLDRVESDGTRYALRPLMAQERTRYDTATRTHAAEYAIVDDLIYLYPRPDSGTYELIYIAQPPDISAYADGDMIDMVCIYGEAFLVWGVTVKALSKSESNVQLAMMERDRNGQKLLEWAAERDANEPRRRVLEDGYEMRTDASGWWNRP